MAKYKELNKKDKRAFWIGAIFALVLLAVAAWLFWEFCLHLYRHEWLEAELQAALFFVGWFWRKNRINKKKVEELEAEVLKLKLFRKKLGEELYKQAFQEGIDFQRRIIADWVEQKTGKKI